jgi:hypothetical protein
VFCPSPTFAGPAPGGGVYGADAPTRLRGGHSWPPNSRGKNAPATNRLVFENSASPSPQHSPRSKTKPFDNSSPGRGGTLSGPSPRQEFTMI